MKKLLALIFSIFIVVSLAILLNGCNNADGKKLKANPIEDFDYEFSSNGEFVYINKYIGTSDVVVIPSKIEGLPVISIKGTSVNGTVTEGAFESCNVKTVIIPESVTAIGLYAFKDCKELINITIPNKLNKLLDGAFQNCVKLENIDLSQTSLSALGRESFSGCSNLKEIKLPDSLLEIEKKAFYDCSSLLEMCLPPDIVKVEENAIANCTSLKTITIPKNLNLLCIENPSVYNTPLLEKIIFEEGREEVSGYAFFDITSNVEIIIPSSVKKFSPMPFFIHSEAKIIFSGNCPEIIEKNDFYGNPTIYYNPSTDGWSECEWKNQYNMLPIK